MRVAVGSDHAGFEGTVPCKPEIIKRIRSLGHDIMDCGTDSLAPVDYPDVAQKVCAAILRGDANCGVLMCGTGIGMGIAANRNRRIRAAVCATAEMARLARDHNNANVLCVGQRVLSVQDCLELVEIFLTTPFSEGERHKRRTAKLG